MPDANSDSSQEQSTEPVGPYAIMAAREQRVMELLKSTKPERIEHDLRNLLNELGLLRVLFDRMEQKDPVSD